MTRQQAIILDIDGTVAELTPDRVAMLRDRQFDQFNDTCATSRPIPSIVNLVRHYVTTSNSLIIVMTGRPEHMRLLTVSWLYANGIYPGKILMRPNDDNSTSDADLKEQWLKKLRDHYGFDIQFALDDRDSVVQMFRRNGVVALQVANGTY